MQFESIRTLSVCAAAVLSLHLSIGASPSRAEFPLAFAEAELFFEENTTDGDLGIHFKLDGPSWKRIILFAPDWSLFLNVIVSGNLKEIGLTEIFSESAEPGFDELPRQDFLDLFDEGTYIFFGLTTDGNFLVKEATLTKNIPEGTPIISPEEDEMVDPDEDLTLRWSLVSDPSPPTSVIEFYEVVVEKDEENEPLRVYSIQMLPTDNQVRVPAEFLEPGKNYKVEIIAQETTGNRSAAEIPFKTMP